MVKGDMLRTQCAAGVQLWFSCLCHCNSDIQDWITLMQLHHLQSQAAFNTPWACFWDLAKQYICDGRSQSSRTYVLITGQFHSL